MAELEQLGNRYPFRIPAFFALILRAFSVIEGIALAVDPDYAIVQVSLSMTVARHDAVGLVWHMALLLCQSQR